MLTGSSILDKCSGSISNYIECSCGYTHERSDHCDFASTMPQDPLELIDDLSRMGFYDPKAIPIAEELSFKEIRKTLFLRMAVQGNPKREKLCNALIQQAGGLDAAFSAAFGPKAGEFFGDAIKASSITRKEFLRNLAVGAALVSLTNCAGPSNDAVTQGAGDDEIIGNLEKTTIKVGFVPITCATPILMAGPRGIYEKYGLNVELVKMPGWAAVRDAISSGELDASHLIAPMPIAMTLGIGSTAFSTRSLIISNLNGNAITVAKQHEQRVKGPADFKGFRIAIPFPYSTHTLLLRYYLATGGLDPDTDVQLDVVPPPDTVAQMSIGDLDAMLIAEPFNQRLVSEGAGYIHMLSKDLWPGHPCCILGAGQEWMDNHPNTFQALTKAVLEAAHYSKDKSNRSEISQTLSTRAFLNQPQEVLDSVYLGNFDDGRGNSLDIPDRVDFDPYPWQSFSHWIVSQMVRWNNLSQEALTDYRQIGEEIFLSELIQEMSTELNLPVPNEKERVEQLMFDSLDPNDPKGYLQNQLEKYGL